MKGTRTGWNKKDEIEKLKVKRMKKKRRNLKVRNIEFWIVQ